MSQETGEREPPKQEIYTDYAERVDAMCDGLLAEAEQYKLNRMQTYPVAFLDRENELVTAYRDTVNFLIGSDEYTDLETQQLLVILEMQQDKKRVSKLNELAEERIVTEAIFQDIKELKDQGVPPTEDDYYRWRDMRSEGFRSFIRADVDSYREFIDTNHPLINPEYMEEVPDSSTEYTKKEMIFDIATSKIDQIGTLAAGIALGIFTAKVAERKFFNGR